jgi:hypothetical protein
MEVVEKTLTALPANSRFSDKDILLAPGLRQAHTGEHYIAAENR